MKKAIGVTLVASMALALSACDWGKSKPAEPVTGNELSMGNEAVSGNETIGNDLTGTDGADNATLVDQAGPETNTVDGNTM